MLGYNRGHPLVSPQATYHTVQLGRHGQKSHSQRAMIVAVGTVAVLAVGSLLLLNGPQAQSLLAVSTTAPLVKGTTTTRTRGVPGAIPVTRAHASVSSQSTHPSLSTVGAHGNMDASPLEMSQKMEMGSPEVSESADAASSAPHTNLFAWVMAALVPVAAALVALTKKRSTPVAAMMAIKTSNDWLSPEALEKAKAPKANKFEKIKMEKPGESVWTSLHEFSAAVRSGEYEYDQINKDDLDIRLKWAGMFHRPKATPGQFMIRLKVPNGVLVADQWMKFGEIISKYGEVTDDNPTGGCADITTRMNMQLRGIKMEDASEAISLIDACGLTSKQSGMDNVRNMVGNPLAGFDPEELIDTRSFCVDIQNMITDNNKGNPEFSNLPRKFNIAVSGSRDDFAHTNINDIGLIPCPNADGVMGFNVDIGGYFSIKRYAEGYPFDLWIPAVDANGDIDTSVAVAFSKAVLTHFRDNGDRGDRQKARLIWLVEKMGQEEWLDAVLKVMTEQDAKSTERLQKRAPYFADGEYKKRDIMGVHNTKTDGLVWVGAVVPAGRLSAFEMAEIARVSNKYSNGETRITVDQNVIFPNVKAEDVEAMLQDQLFQGNIQVNAGPLMKGFVSCTGAQFCPVAMVETKQRATQVMLDLEQKLSFPTDEPIRVHWTGCPNSCGQAQCGQIGLMGGPAKKLNEETGKKMAVQGFNILLGGKQGEAPELGEIHEKGIPADDIAEYLEKVLIEKHGAKLKA